MGIINSLFTVLDEAVKKSDKFAVFPCGCAEPYLSIVLRDRYGITPLYYIDNNKRSDRTVTVEEYLKLQPEDVYILIAAFNGATYRSCLSDIEGKIDSRLIVDCFPVEIGKFTPISGVTDAKGYLKSIGAYCSISPGAEVVGSHIYTNVSTCSFFSGGGGSGHTFVSRCV